MNGKQTYNRVVNYLSIIILLFFFGCSIEKNHKILSLFFDGVDQVVMKNDYLSHDSLNKDAILKREMALKKNRPDKCVHLPFKEKKCYVSCHTEDKHLQKPLPALCYQCHTNFQETYKYVHGPVASGNCLNCHHQHYATYSKLLIRGGQEVCTYCHSSSLVFKSSYHKNIEDLDCWVCHSPHGSNSRYMLKDQIVRAFKGRALVNELASRHLTGQLYSTQPGDIKDGVVVNIVGSDNEVVATVVTDSLGKFSFDNMHPNQDYSFKLKTENPIAHVNVLDYNNNIVSTIERGRKGLFNFDKVSYQNAHEAVSANLPQLASTTQPTNTTEQPKDTSSLAKVTDTAKVAEVPKEQEVAKNTTQDSNKVVSNELGAPVKINNNADYATVKLSGHTFKFSVGTVICVLDQKGGLAAIAKVDANGNFVLDKTLGGQDANMPADSNIYSKIVFLNYKTDDAQNIMSKKHNEQGALNQLSYENINNKKIDNLNIDAPTGNNEKPFSSTIYYNLGKATLTDAGLDELDKVITYLDNYAEAIVNLTGHTDTRGSKEINLKLSEKRVQNAANYLISQGISKNRIMTKGLGKEKPVNKCTDGVPCTEKEHRENRRVEVLITDR